MGFLNWDRKLHALVSSHDTHLVLDKSYSPTPGSDEHEVFQAMKVHMWAVFVDKVKEPNGASMIGGHEATSDPQTLYAALHDHYKNSQVAVL